jgi:hypothetical protein
MKVPTLDTERIAIVGFGEADRELIPWDDTSLEIWGLNMAHGWMKRWDRLFEMHHRTEIELETAELKRDVDHLGGLRAERKRPIYMIEAQPDIPCSVTFPIQEFFRFFGTHCEKLRQQPYVTSSFGFMLGLAIMYLIGRRADPWVPEPLEEILIFGVPLLNDEEYAYQRENATFFAGYALGRGITLTFTPHAAWLEADGVYGYAEPSTLNLLSRLRVATGHDRDEYAAKIKELDAEFAAIQRKVNSLDGARQYAELMIKRFTLLSRGAKL